MWSWDISKLRGPGRFVFYHLHVVIDIYSRRVVGWLLATRESAELAAELLKETMKKERVEREQLTIHADRGISMASKEVASCSLTWRWPKATRAHTARTTIRTRRRTSRRSSTVPGSRSRSPRSNRAASSAGDSSAGHDMRVIQHPMWQGRDHG